MKFRAVPFVILLSVLIFGVLACAKGAFNDSEGFEPRPSNQPSNVYVYHDDARGATCWLAYESISCLSDRDLEP